MMLSRPFITYYGPVLSFLLLLIMAGPVLSFLLFHYLWWAVLSFLILLITACPILCTFSLVMGGCYHESFYYIFLVNHTLHLRDWGQTTTSPDKNASVKTIGQTLTRLGHLTKQKSTNKWTNIRTKFIHSNGHFLQVNNFKLTTPTHGWKTIKIWKQLGFQSSINQKTSPNYNFNTIHDPLRYRMCTCKREERRGITILLLCSNSKTQAGPPLCDLFLCLLWVRIDQIFQWFCFSVSGPTCFFQELS